ncbi:MAG: hypothetical protein CMN87_18165 [Stappia sp.]|uniref:hypothetical protein n=1 Tax=Stappia sp. TaxID=1870903 RepID=UPI000C539564|nr:hypothetical protein [Stappia sp.]MAA97398.1 hypothetical protein [Stappia sp.]MBM21931.1 hypothetical protein [Stappia sp.]
MTWLLSLGARLKAWLALAGAVAVAIAAAYVTGRRSAAAEARAERAREQLDAMRARKEIDDEVDAMGAADLDAEYRRWLRDGDR